MPITTTFAEGWVQLLAAGCVAVYAWERFSTPAAYRSTTTRWQWNLALVSYVAAAVALWWVVMMVISTNPEAARFIMFGMDTKALFDSEEKAREIVGLSAPFASALFLTALLPHLPLLKKLDGAFRTIFRELGAIPKRARQLAQKVRAAEFAVPRHLLRDVERELGAQRLCAEALMAADPYSAAWEWVRIVTLKTRLCAELDDPEFEEARDEDEPVERHAPFVEHRLAEYRQLMVSYRRLTSLASIVLAETGAPDRDPVLEERRDGLLKTFEKESSELFRGLSHFVSCYLLSTQFSMRAAVEALAGWGFTPRADDVRPVLCWHDAVGLALLTTAYMYGWFQSIGGGTSDQQRLIIAVTVGLSMAAAALLAGVPGILSRRRRRAAEGGLTFGFYVLAGALAALCWCAILYLRLLITDAASLSDYLAELATKFPYMLMPAGAAFSIALLIDLDLRSRLGSEWLGRAADGICLALAMGAVGGFAADLIQSIAGRGPDPVRMIAVQAGLGLMLGPIVPTLYRRARLRAGEDAEDEERLAAAAVHA